jgi:hypothetical protein
VTGTLGDPKGYARQVDALTAAGAVVCESNAAAARLAGLVEILLVYPEAIKANLDRLGGLIHSQRVLLALTQAGMSREAAYAAVQRVVGGVNPLPTDIVGTVPLQGRSLHDGTAIHTSTQACSATASGNQVATTDAQGRFNLPNPGQPQCLWAVRPGFLSGQRAAPIGNLGTLVLLAGDVNSDNAVNIFDMAAIAGRYGGGDPISDFNGDRVVNIFDLAIAATNYGKVGPLTDWR